MRVLVIDDEKNILKSITMYLEGHGYDVVASEKGLEGLRLAEERLPNLIVLDLILPDISGYAICKALKEHPATCEVPILIMSAKSQEEDSNKAFDAGADAYIIKPFIPGEFLAVVKRLLKED